MKYRIIFDPERGFHPQVKFAFWWSSEADSRDEPLYFESLEGAKSHLLWKKTLKTKQKIKVVEEGDL